MEALEAEARRSGRTRSAVAQEILVKHLDVGRVRKGRSGRLLELAGAGAHYSTYKSDDEIDATIKYLRGVD